MNSTPPYGAHSLTDLFPRSADYQALCEGSHSQIGEAPAHEYGSPLSERHVQCVWYDAHLRPTALCNHLGESIQVVDPGRWNLEAGPDFLDATLLVGPDQRLVRGDVEIHTHPRNWRQHRHGEDPRYQRVCAHVTYYPGTLPSESLPPGAHQVALQEALDKQSAFFINDIDVTAYPIEMAQRPKRFRVFDSWTIEQKILLIEAAGEERLRHKSECFARRTERSTIRQCFYEDFMGALGYKHNKQPCQRLAKAAPLQRLEAETDGNALCAYAILLGVAGLLPEDLATSWDAQTQDFVRSLWDTWWPKRTSMEAMTGEPIAWSRTHGRPSNSPVRRLYAAAELFYGRPSIFDLIQRASGRGGDCMAIVMKHLTSVKSTYWSKRYSLGGTVGTRPTALIGPGRAASIVLNVIIPYAVARGWKHVVDRSSLDGIPPEPTNSLIRDTAAALFGAEHSPRHWRSGLRQQGLLQIYQDFYLTDRSHEVLLSCPLALGKTASVTAK